MYCHFGLKSAGRGLFFLTRSIYAHLTLASIIILWCGYPMFPVHFERNTSLCINPIFLHVCFLLWEERDVYWWSLFFRGKEVKDEWKKTRGWKKNHDDLSQFQTQDPLLPNYRSHRCKPWRIGERIGSELPGFKGL